tara:strand:+ start:578742 stop:579266 length:525 start_codon:yes stop_codon:yes gene_type:complete
MGMYLIDFDRTVFDTDSFINYLKTHDAAKQFSALPELELASALNAAVQEGSLQFAPGELSKFLYEDAARFLRDKENGVMLITYGNADLQKAKVESALFGIPRISTMYTGEIRKGEYLAPHIGMYGQSPVFVDDSIPELEIMTINCPQVRCFEMRRDGATGDGRWDTLHSLTELG